jgi:hypothetical protein
MTTTRPVMEHSADKQPEHLRENTLDSDDVQSVKAPPRLSALPTAADGRMGRAQFGLSAVLGLGVERN